MLAPLLTVVTLLIGAPAVRASPCVAMDVNWNLLAFGLDSKDWNAGTQGQWTSGKATDITTSGRPPFDGTNTTCYLSQFTNAIYVMNGDASNPSNIHIYDAAAKSWSTQSVTTGNFDPSSFNAILDHDTNVFYALSKGELFSVDMALLKSANSTPLPWNDIQKAPYADGYQPVMALAQNHIHFIDVPGTPTGDANIFVIHFSYFQPEPQPYPVSDGSTFPATHGQATSFFQQSGVQQEFAFIPDDGSKTYVINVETNTTQALAGPTTKDAKATYFAGITSLVQLDSTGAVSYLPYQQGSDSVNAAATWSSVSALSSVAPPGSGSAASATASASGSAKVSGTSSTKATSSAGSSSSGSASASSGPSSGAVPRGVVGGILGGFVIGALALLL
ncbi:hypothetical protein EW146_g3473 [Bondarzewia mesenterica]|uniref:Uncharacterized protein n=1 Tax=Bondarzewia mesenterica TaxID=1095465 RepID=A0A4S4LXX0_9AGAM|nr:hypothetical protein EW146_g3473 [Bondarzewia mesenterica]